MTSPEPVEVTAARRMLAGRGRFPSAGSVPFYVARDLIAAATRQQEQRIAELEAALRGVIGVANSFCDESADDLAYQVKLRARLALKGSSHE